MVAFTHETVLCTNLSNSIGNQAIRTGISRVEATSTQVTPARNNSVSLDFKKSKRKRTEQEILVHKEGRSYRLCILGNVGPLPNKCEISWVLSIISKERGYKLWNDQPWLNP